MSVPTTTTRTCQKLQYGTNGAQSCGAPAHVTVEFYGAVCEQHLGGVLLNVLDEAVTVRVTKVES